MGTPFDRPSMNGPDSAFPACPKKGEGAAAFSSDRPAKAEGMVLPWLMAMPEPSEAMKIGSRSIEKAPASGNRISVEATVTPLVAEREKGNSSPAAGGLREESQDQSCGRDEGLLPLPTGITPMPGLSTKEDIAEIDTAPKEKRLQVETYVAAEAPITPIVAEHEKRNARPAPGNLSEKSDWDFGASDERHVPHTIKVAPTPGGRPQQEIANVQAGVHRPEQSEFATPSTTQESKQGGRVVLVASIFTASVLCLWSIVWRSSPDLPHETAMTSSAASVAGKQEPVRTGAQEIETGFGRSETSSQPMLSSQPESSFESQNLTIAEPSANAAKDGSTHAAPASLFEQKASGEASITSAASEKSSHPQGESQPVVGSLEWRTFEVPEFGTRVQFPANIFAPAGQPERGSGQQFKSADGRAILSVYSRPNATGETPATYLKQNLRVDRSTLDYHRVARSFFAISSERDGVILYSRCNFSGRGRRAIHCFDIRYPQEEKRSWDSIITRISRSLRPLG
jgi:hypothetical protein